MFDLEKEIDRWTSLLRSEDSLVASSVAELESHLRDTIEELSGEKLTQKEAFTVAAMRIGQSSDLALEFDKVDEVATWRKRALWMVGGYVGGGAIAAVIGGVGSLSSVAALASGFSGTIAGATSIAVTGLGWLMFFLFVRSGPSSHSSKLPFPRSPTALFATIIVLTMTGRAMGWAGSIMQIQVASMDRLGETMAINAYGAIALNVGVFIACLSILSTFYASNKVASAQNRF